MSHYSILKEEWDKILKQPILSYTIFAIESKEFGQDYEPLKPSEITHISFLITH